MLDKDYNIYIIILPDYNNINICVKDILINYYIYNTDTKVDEKTNIYNFKIESNEI